MMSLTSRDLISEYLWNRETIDKDIFLIFLTISLAFRSYCIKCIFHLYSSQFLSLKNMIINCCVCIPKRKQYFINYFDKNNKDNDMSSDN